ncbi:DUF192 domain-containing protein [Halobellus limi]|uniref:DUF192 domain-containing protein n=1 Tax=Halobellus limi TaxID=699433 RepID=A0A1H5WI66_9EURY|nr:DUF192 domain-containing protein [Halobellus limi]QCC46438.1 DUF192 domain-containing protein [Halobellus limi]SEF99095.1 hypothetical protein SAMN04488133_1282 [Halobellus limi]
MHRRTYLGLLGSGAAGLSGCVRDTSGVDDAASDTTRTTGSSPTSATTETAAPPASTSEPTTTVSIHEDYETTEVEVRTPDGDPLGSVTAAIADTGELRYLGLSDTEFLPEDRGMLFVYENVGDRTFVMREMDFGIDIVYADADGTITRIHHAPEPAPDEDGNAQRYPGRGRFVLEVGFHWTTDRGITEGDQLAFTLPE